MNVRIFRQNDRPSIEQILSQSWPAEPTMRQLHDLHGFYQDAPWRRTLVAETQEGVVGVGTVRLESRHPERYWLALNVLFRHGVARV